MQCNAAEVASRVKTTMWRVRTPQTTLRLSVYACLNVLLSCWWGQKSNRRKNVHFRKMSTHYYFILFRSLLLKVAVLEYNIPQRLSSVYFLNTSSSSQEQTTLLPSRIYSLRKKSMSAGWEQVGSVKGSQSLFPPQHCIRKSLKWSFKLWRWLRVFQMHVLELSYAHAQYG